MAVDAIGIWCTILLGIARMADSVSSFVSGVPSTAKACTVCDSYETFRISRRGSEAWFRLHLFLGVINDIHQDMAL